ncbi:HEAT repeat domain-containing protein [Marinimicrobium sp. ABcell2]|uniref:HEAT repeat domain-containing protein n=1 Tax=Marinimicrobium sp. ABcell2 TaxID=3069751 RepID=UPI0027B45990|nr:HEAT repeat domain-containing protein [Marinimicrobium sp. ABcell2]MDQ2076616.1 HEAT repeat domain-containing protein [Marinimicrobium sp. ABcell2]
MKLHSLPFRLGAPLTVALSCSLLAGCFPEKPSDQPRTEPVAALPAHESDPVVASDSEIREAVAYAKSQVNLQLAEGLTGQLWASEHLVGDPVAIHADNQGRVWTTITHRRRTSELDIRSHRDWEFESMSFRTVEDRRNFLHRELAPERSEHNLWLDDRNQDGSHDWRDLAVYKEEVLLLEDTTGDGRANQRRVYLKDFHTEVTDVLGGIYFHDQLEELFLTVSPDAWRVKDSSGDGRADTKTSIAHGFGVHIGFGGHGMSGLTLGPDGRLYYAIGDVGMDVTDRDGKRWPYSNQGVIVRSEVDGSNFEVFASGLRNAHEFAFDEYGNLIGVDNDGDHDGEYERIVYLVDGSDSGWRTYWQLGKYRDPKNNRYRVWMDEDYYQPHFPEQAAHLLPPIAPFESGPAGMTYNPGTALSESWQGHFFVAEFLGTAARSGISAFTLEPNGASFALSAQKPVLRGFQATGLSFGPEGSLYAADWLEGWALSGEGRIWKVDVTPELAHPQRAETQALLAEDFTAQPSNQLLNLLDHADMRVRQKAQFEMVRRDARGELLKTAKHGEQQLARIHALWGLGQMARAQPAQARDLVPLLEDPDPEVRAQAAKLIGDAGYAGANQALQKRLRDDEARVRFFAAQALGQIGDPNALGAVVSMLEDNNDQDIYLRQAGAIALARIGDESALAELRHHRSDAVRIAALIALGRMQSPALGLFLEEDHNGQMQSEFIVTNAARLISDDQFVADALPPLAALLAEPPFHNEPLLRRLINANLYVGGEQSAQRLVDFALDTTMAGHLRTEALDTLAVWTDSSTFDRVTGRYRGAVQHAQREAQQPLALTYQPLLRDSNLQVREAAIQALAELNVSEAGTALRQVLSEDTQPTVRKTALLALHKLGFEPMNEVATIAMQDDHSSVRMAGLELLPQLGLPTAETVAMHSILLANGSISEQQSALRSLATIDSPQAHNLLAQQMQLLQEGDLAPELQLDVLEAAHSTGAPSLQKLISDYQSRKDPDQPLERHRESLWGGDAEAGEQLFFHDSSAQCIRCHTVGGRGNPVGPDLTEAGTRLSREQLLQALVDPGARVSPGFGRITVTLSDGRQLSGHFEAEDEHTLTLMDRGEKTKIEKSEVTSRRYSGSGMPSMEGMLSASQLRDLVAYLTQLTAADQDR